MKWEKVKLKEIALAIQTGPFGSQLHQSDYSKNGIPVVMPKDLLNGKISEQSIARVSKIHVNRLKRHIISNGDILYSRRGDVGRCAYATEYETGWLCGTGCLRVTINTIKANSKFIFYQLQQPSIVGWVQNHAVGSTMLNLNTAILSEIPLLLPTLCIQTKIADILSAYDELIENNQKQIKLLEESAQRLYKEWFVDLRFPGYENTPIIDGVPKGWKKEDLINLVDIQYGYAFKGSLFNNIGKGMPIIRIRNIPDGQTTDFTTEKVSKEYIIHNGDILVGMDGEFYVNSWGGEDAYLVQRTCCFRPKFNNMKGYLLQAILEPIKFFEKTVVGATVTHLGKKHINTIKIFSVPNVLYEPFQMWYEKRQSLVNQNRLLTEARNRLISQIMGRKFII